MKTETIHTTLGRSEIYTGENFQNIEKYIPCQKQLFVLIDENVNRIYKKHLSFSHQIIIPAGEESKSWEKVQMVYRGLLELGCNRNSFLLGVGGGVTCDLAGFVASTFMRGIEFGFISTTLLSQIDAAIGGKTAINLDGYKNIIGSFAIPRFVINDVRMLSSLPNLEIEHAMAELIKTAIVGSKELFLFIERYVDEILCLEEIFLLPAIEKAVEIKVKLVNEDVFDKGIRNYLNLGHTWGHAIEKTRHLKHGEAVALGLLFASKVSVHYGKLSENKQKRIEKLISACQLGAGKQIDIEKAFQTLKYDKKKEADAVKFILIEDFGKVFSERITWGKMQQLIKMYG